MRIVHIADLHLGKSLFDFSLISDQRAWLASLVTLLRAQKADALVIAGDVYQRSVPSTEAVGLLDDFLSEVVRDVGIPVLMIAGNHDSGERLGFASRLFEQGGLFVAGALSKSPKTVTLPDAFGEVTFVLLPYFEPYPIRRLYDDNSIKTCNDAFARIAREGLSQLDYTKRNVLVAHGFFGRDAALARFSDSERSVGGTDLVDSSLVERFDYVALGHLHAPQTAGAAHIRYAGSPLKYSLSEATQHKSVTIIDLNAKGDVRVQSEIIPPAHDLRIVTGTLRELTDKALQEKQRLDDYVYAVITDKNEVYGAMDKLRAVFPNVVGLKRMSDETGGAGTFATGAQIARKTPDELFASFYRDMLGEDITPARAKIIHEVLRAAEREEHDL
ncbi:MAG: exonuclease SbcCD subunit D [Acetanaerobacterium sp.]